MSTASDASTVTESLELLSSENARLRQLLTQYESGAPLRRTGTGHSGRETANDISLDHDGHVGAATDTSTPNDTHTATPQAFDFVESALHASEERYRQLIELMPDCVFLQSEGRIRLINRAGAALLGYDDPAALEGVDLVERIIHPDLHATYRTRRAKLEAGEAVPYVESLWFRRDGSQVWVEVGASPMTYQGRPASLTVARDITERKRSEQALRESEERYRQLIELMPDCVYIQSEGRIRFINRAGARLLGFDDPAQVVDLDIAERMVPVNLRTTYLERRAHLEAGEQVPLIEGRWLRRDGSDVQVEVASAPMTHAGKPAGLTVARDITKRKRHEANLAFLAGIAEDLSRLTTPDEIMQVVGQKIGEVLRVQYCHFMAIDEAHDQVIYLEGWNASEVPRLPDKVRLSAHVSDAFYQRVHAGLTVVSNNTQTNPITPGQENKKVGALAFITVPFLTAGRWTHLFSVHDIQPREWRDDEVELVHELAERVFPRLERARAEARLRASHDTFRHLVEHSPFGIYIVDADFRLVQVSAGAQRVFETVRPLLGRDFAEVLRILWPEPFANEAIGHFRRTLETGEPYRAPSTVEQRQDIDQIEAYDWQIERITLPDGRFGVVCHFYDLSDRQRYEAALEASEARLRHMADAMPQLVWIAGPDGTVHYFNQRVSQFGGMAHLDGGVWSWQPALHPADAEATMRTWQAAVAQAQPYAMEHRLRMADGTCRWHLSRATPEQDAAGHITQWFGTATDIHDLKLAEARLADSNARFSIAEEAARSFSYDWDIDADMVTRSDGLTAVLGYVPGELPGAWEAWAALIHPDDVPFATKAQAIDLLNAYPERAYSLEYRVRHKAGHYRWVYQRSLIVRDPSGRVGRTIGQIVDITERKVAEDQLRQSEARLRLSLAASSAGTWSWDVVTNTSVWDDRYHELYGFAPDMPRTFETWISALHPGDQTRLVERIAHMLATPGDDVWNQEFRVLHPLLGERWMLGLGNLERAPDGRPVRMTGINLDITARKAAEDRLARLQTITTSLAETQSLNQVRQVILNEILKTIGADAGGLRRVTAHGLVLDEYHFSDRFDQDFRQRAHLIELDAHHPAAHAARTGEDVFIASSHELAAHYPSPLEIVTRQGTQAVAQLPLKRSGETFMVLSLNFAEGHVWDEGERAFARALADRAAVAYERARLFEAVREGEAHFRELADAMPQIVWASDASGQVTYLNQRWLDYTGLAVADGLQDPDAHIHPEDRPTVRAVWADKLAHSQPFEYEMRSRRADGEYRWHLARCTPVCDAFGHVTIWYGTSTDIHERKQAELDAQFLATLTTLFKFTSDRDNDQTLMWQVGRATAEHLGAARAGFNEVDRGHGTLIFHRDYGADMSSIAGKYPLALFGATLTAAMGAGAMMVISDAATDPRTSAYYASTYWPHELRAVLSVPLMRGSQWVASFWVAALAQHDWDRRETSLVCTVAERAWLAVESARLQAQTAALNRTLEARVAARTAELSESQAQLRKLSAYAERAREEERTRIACDVHDQLGGALTVLKMSLARVRKGREGDLELAAKVQDVRNQADELVQAVRRVSSDLRPPVLDDFGLGAALEWQVHEWEKRTGITCLVDLPDQEAQLDRDRRTAMFRVFQESLTNIARHAHASTVTVKLAAESEGGKSQMVLTVQDDGVGIPEEALQPGKSLGLLGMRERMREVQGEADIAGLPGQGTTVTIRAPLS